MPPGVEADPLALFRTLARHPALSERLRALGGHFLGSRARLPVRLRELVILRTCARCGAEYEWGVHAASFAAAAGLDEAALRMTAAGGASRGDSIDDCALAAADELHASASLSDATWERLRVHLDEEQCLELLALSGFYHLISFVVNGARVALEPWATRFPQEG
jgi:alkylhydroperoxidase family enzyme